MKFRVNAYNSSSVKLFTGWKETSIATASPGTNEIVIPLTSIDDGVEPENPVIVSAEIQSEIVKGTSGNIITINIKHTNPIIYDVTADQGITTYDSSADTGNNITALKFFYTAPSEATTDTLTVYAQYLTSSDRVGTFYPINIVSVITSTTRFTVLFGPVATGMNFFRKSNALDVEVLADASGDMSYEWTGDGDLSTFEEYAEESEKSTILLFTNTSAGTVTVEITDSQTPPIKTSLTRTIVLGSFNSSMWDSSPTILPDTGQTQCYDAIGDTISCPEPGEEMAQDGSYPLIPQSFTDNGDQTIFDNNTKLMWQADDNGTKTYSSIAVTYCTGLSVGGHSDWRVPTAKELLTLVDHSKSRPAISTTYFPDASADYYLTSTTGYSYKMAVNFTQGITYENQSTQGYTRCVRSRYGSLPSIWALDATNDSEDPSNVVKHAATSLLWRKTPSTSSGTWLQAFNTCKGLSDELNYWRLPNINELLSIADYSGSTPYIDTSLFSGNTNYDYWSSTTNTDSTSDALTFNYCYGSVYSKLKSSTAAFVRCVKNQ